MIRAVILSIVLWVGVWFTLAPALGWGPWRHQCVECR